MNPAAAIGLVCVFLVALLIGLIIGSVILRAACWMCGVKEPGTWRAMGIVLLTGLINGAIGFVVGLAVQGFVAGAGMPRAQVQALNLLANLGTLPINMLVCAGIYTATLRDRTAFGESIPVTFGKGILIWLAQLLIGILIAVAVAIVVAVVFLIAQSAGGFR